MTEKKIKPCLIDARLAGPVIGGGSSTQAYSDPIGLAVIPGRYCSEECCWLYAGSKLQLGWWSKIFTSVETPAAPGFVGE